MCQATLKQKELNKILVIKTYPKIPIKLLLCMLVLRYVAIDWTWVLINACNNIIMVNILAMTYFRPRVLSLLISVPCSKTTDLIDSQSIISNP